MSEFKDRNFNGGKYRLDNNTYINCNFTNCTLEFGGESPVDLAGCNFIQCEWILSGHAQNTLSFLSGMYHGMGDFGKNMVEGTFDNIKQNKK